jgi:hypothetical protein
LEESAVKAEKTTTQTFSGAADIEDVDSDENQEKD